MANPFPDFGVSRDVRFDNISIIREAIIDGTEVSCPSANILSSRIFNDASYDNAIVSDALEICGATLTSPATDEVWDAYRQVAMRIEAAREDQSPGLTVLWSSNSDESTIPMFIAMFSKTLPHDGVGRVTSSSYILMRDGILERDIAKLSSAVGPGTLKFVQPLASFLLNLTGVAPSSISLPAAPSMSSAEAAGEMVECYCQALCRDVPFVDFGTDLTVASCVGYLSALSDYKGPTPVTTANIFRGLGTGESVGPHISQIFFLSHTLWPYTIPATIDFPTRSVANDRMITSVTYLSVQNGTVTEGGPTLSGTPTYLSTGRDLAYCVWQDLPGQWYVNAALRVIEEGCPFSPLSPYLNSPLDANQDAFVTWSAPDLLSCLHITAQTALSSAWYGKWVVNRRLRPEAFGNEAEQYRLTMMNPASINSDLLTSGVLADIFALNGNHYLPQAYPEGSPSHPSYPAGHAVASGACITVIKAFLDDTWVFPSPVVPNAAGTMLSAIGDTLTLSGELNKLAGSSISLGRDWAGVHVRSEGHEGILQGEQIAIKILTDWINRYSEPDAQFSFTGYMGNSIIISPTTTFGANIDNPDN